MRRDAGQPERVPTGPTRERRGGRKARGWCFTDNKPEEGPLNFDEDIIRFAVWQRERGGGTGHIHHQGYIYFHNATTAYGVKCMLRKPGVHIEIAKGSLQHNLNYCTKEDTRCEEEGSGPFFIGDYDQTDLDNTRLAGKRGEGSKASSLDEWGERAKQRGGIEQIIDTRPGIFMRYYNGLNAIRNQSIKPRDWNVPPHVEVRYGPSGSGKTHSVYAQYGDSEIYSKDETRWWNGYDGHKVILLDDFAGDSREIPPTQLLKILDRYPIRVQTKGGYLQLSQSVLIITSSIHYHEWYQGSGDWIRQIQAFERRVTVWRTFPEGAEQRAISEVWQPTNRPRVDRDPYTGQVYTTH